MPRRTRSRGVGGGREKDGPVNNEESDTESEGVIDSEFLEVEETDRVGVDHEAATEDEGDRQPGPSSKGKLARDGGKKQGKKAMDKRDFGAEEAGGLDRMSGVIDDVMKFLQDTAKATLPLLAGEDKKKDKKKILKRLHTIGVEMIEAQEKLKVVPDSVMAAYNNLDLEELAQQEKDPDQLSALLDEFDEASKKEMDDRSKDIGMKEVYKNNTYQSFLEVLDEFYRGENSGGDVDDGTEPEQIPGPSSRFDPFDIIGACSLTDPYENKICKHVYEYESVMGMIITSNGKTRCPYSGCTNKKFILVEDLFKNPAMAAKIAYRIQQDKCGIYMTVD